MTMLMDAKTLIGPPLDSSGTYDGLLEDIITGILAGADEFMEAGCQQVEGAEVYFDGGERTLYLPHFNVFNVSVYVDGVILSSEDYALYPGTGIAAAKVQIKSGKFPSGQRIVKVIYDGGYEEDDYPPSLRRKLLKQVSYEFRRRNDPGLSAVSYPDGSVQKFAQDEWLPDVEAELLRRRRIFL